MRTRGAALLVRCLPLQGPKMSEVLEHRVVQALPCMQCESARHAHTSVGAMLVGRVDKSCRREPLGREGEQALQWELAEAC